MTIRNSRPEDLNFCAELDARTFNESKSVMLREMKKKFEDGDYTTLIIEKEKLPIGFCTFVNKMWNSTAYIELLIIHRTSYNRRQIQRRGHGGKGN